MNDFADLPRIKVQNYKLFDLTARELTEIEIKKGYDGSNCYITDKTNNYSGFILSNKKDTQTICEVVFFKSSEKGLYIPRLTFSKIKLSTNTLKESKNPEKVRIAFDNSSEGLSEFWKMIGFLSNFKDLVDLGEFKRKFRVIGLDEVVLHLQDLGVAERINEIIKYTKSSGISPDIFVKNILHVQREETLHDFKKLLDDSQFFEDYRQRHEKQIKGPGGESVWHHFLKNNIWLLGINLDVRFIEDFTDEVSVGNPDTENRDNPKVDLMGIADYTVLVELKTPTTNIFTKEKTSNSRAGTWSFTQEFIEGFSQCLSQKSFWDKESKGKDLIKNGNVLNQNHIRTVDPKIIYIVGCKSKELPTNSDSKDVHLKRDTFERFRRNNRNVEIITYDELYNRSAFILTGKK